MLSAWKFLLAGVWCLVLLMEMSIAPPASRERIVYAVMLILIVGLSFIAGRMSKDDK